MSTNRFFTLLVVMSLIGVAALTVRDALATSAVLSNTERAQAADTARWNAMAEHYVGVEAVSSRSRAADTARWTAMGEYYEKLAAFQLQNLERGRAADLARWNAMAEYYLQLNSASK